MLLRYRTIAFGVGRVMFKRKSPAKVDPKATIWNCWSSNMVYDDGEPGYIIHMFEEFGDNPSRTLCGVRYQDGGLLNLHEVEPGCMKCRRILIKRGLLEP